MAAPQPPQRIIAVCGSTGKQGGSVAHFLLQDGTFRVRGLTRNPDSPAAKVLVSKGVEIVQADYNEPDSVRKAFEGAYGVFGVTDFWERGFEEGLLHGEENERREGKTLVDAAKASGIQHFVWSTVDHNDVKCGPWESKADVNDYLIMSGVPRTSLYTCFYYENYWTMAPLLRTKTGDLELTGDLVTDAPIACYCADDTGAWVLAAFKDPTRWIGADMKIAAQFTTPREMAKALTKVLGEPVIAPEITRQAFEASRGQPGVVEIFWRNEMILCSNPGPPFRDVELSGTLYPGMKRAEDAFRDNKEEILARVVSAPHN